MNLSLYGQARRTLAIFCLSGLSPPKLIDVVLTLRRQNRIAELSTMRLSLEEGRHSLLSMYRAPSEPHRQSIILAGSSNILQRQQQQYVRTVDSACKHGPIFLFCSTESVSQCKQFPWVTFLCLQDDFHSTFFLLCRISSFSSE